jgi:hypothetical protein
VPSQPLRTHFAAFHLKSTFGLSHSHSGPCGSCGKTSAALRCAACKSVFYCDKYDLCSAELRDISFLRFSGTAKRITGRRTRQSASPVLQPQQLPSPNEIEWTHCTQ